MSIEIKSDILAKELNQGIVPLGVPKAYQYDAALVEAARAAVNQGLDDVAEAGATAKAAIETQETASVNAVSAQEQASKADVNALGDKILAQMKHGYGYPFTAATAAAMTDTAKIYVYTGSEAGYTNGNWYYHNGTAWVSGGVYNATALETDKTLTISGAAANSSTVGENIFPLLNDKSQDNIIYLANDYEKLVFPGIWEQGDISKGRDTGSTNHIRTKKIIKITQPLSIFVDESLVFWIANYDDNGNYIGASNALSGVAGIGPCNFRITARKTDSSAIEPYGAAKLFTIDNYISKSSYEEKIKLSNSNVLLSEFEYGDIYNGNLTGNFQRGRTKNIITYDKQCNVYFDSTKYQVSYVYYQQDGTYISRSSWARSGFIKIRANTPFRLVVQNLDNSMFTPKTLADLLNEITVSFIGDIPNYYTNYLDDKSISINTKNHEFVNDIQFAFFTDLHIGGNSCNSPGILNRISKMTALPLVICGGDIPVNSGTESLLYEEAKDWVEFYNSIKIPTLMVHGNHDWQIAEAVSGGTDYNIQSIAFMNYYSVGLMKNLEIDGVYGRRYYYYNDSVRKVRYIVIDDFEAFYDHPEWGIRARITQEQADWLVNTALNVPEGYFVVVVSHAPSDTEMDSNIPYNVNVLHPILEAYASKTLANFTFVGSDSNGTVTINKDFSNYNGTLVAHICGHNHKDQSYQRNGVWCISTACDAHYSDDGIDRTIGTTSEQVVDIFSIDTVNRLLYATRLGAGSDRGGWSF